MLRPRWLPATVLVSLAVILALPAGVAGHALLQSSDPARGATLGSAPTSVTLTFGEAPEQRLSSIKVLDKDGANHATGTVELVPGDSLSLHIAVGALPDGVYTVSWRTVSAVDGHVAAGSYAFGVGVAPPGGGGAVAAETSAGGSPAAILARFLLYGGLMVLLGVGYVGFFVGRAGVLRTDVLVRVATGAWLVAAIGTAFTVTVSWDDAGITADTLLTTSTGLAGLTRLLVIAVAAIPAFRVGRVPDAVRPRWLGLAGLGAAAAMTVDVGEGHAATAAAGWIGLLTQWGHVMAAGLWIGGLFALLLSLLGTPSSAKAAAVRRFSTWAAPWIGLVAITGVVRAVQEVGTIGALFGQPYGQLVIGKTALLVMLAGLGATNRWWSVPAADRTLGRVRRVGTAELGIATVVIALAGALVNGVPPVSIGAVAASAPRPIVVTGADRGTSVRVRLAISPGAAGANVFDAVVADYDTGQPAPATGISLHFKLLSREGVGASTLALASASGGSAGTYSASGTNLSVDGLWGITATISQPGIAAVVDFVVATSLAPQPVDVLPATGAPTLYSVALPDGTTAQVYLDPGSAGTGELHCTFFDAQGTERQLTQATMEIGLGAGQALTPRILEPGHFVADVEVPAGSLPVDVVGLDAAGTQVHVHVTIEVSP